MGHHNEEKWLSWIDELSQNDFVVIDGFLDDELYATIRSFFLTHLEDFSRAGIGALAKNLVEESIRGDRTYWLDRKRDETLISFWTLVDETIHMLNRYCFLSLSGYEFHLAHYPPGGHYDKHVDQFAERNNRMISMVIYLNEGWQPGDGGELEVFRNDGFSVVLEPLAKRCVMFKSADVPHAVLEASKNRYSLTGWLLYQPAALGKFLG